MAQVFRRIGKYELLDEIGRGGFAVVYKARDTRLGREVALKVIKGNFAQDQAFADRFKAEVQTSARLRHPNIVAVFDFDDLDGVLYLVMELIEGRSLRAYLDECPRLSLDQALPILSQVAAALDYLAGQQLVHRDIKPANILLEHEADQLQVKLTDFGLVRSLESSTQLTQSASVLGTPAYMSPEQADSQRWGSITSAADIYSLGEMLAGRLPFDGETLTLMHAHAYDQPPSPLQYAPDLGVAVADVLLRALAKPPQLRYPSAGEFVVALQQVQRTRQQQAQQRTELDQFVEQAQAARSAKEWLRLQGLCYQIMQLDRTYPEALVWMGEATVELQRESAEEVTRRQRIKRYEEGEAALNAGQWQTAIVAFEEVAQGNPDFREVQQKLATARDELQRAQWYDEAIAHAEVQHWAEASRVWLKVLQGRLGYHNYDAAARLLISAEGLLAQFDEAVRYLTRTTREVETLQEALRLYDTLALLVDEQTWPRVITLAEQLQALPVNLKQPEKWLAQARKRVELVAALPVVTAFSASMAKMLSADRLTWLTDGKEMVRVPAGEFLYGEDKQKLNLPEFWIDKTPITNAEYARFVAATKCAAPQHWKGQSPAKEIAEHPVVNVSHEDATAYAKRAGKRLPSEQEWEKAARGTDGRTYPWGDQQPTDKLCNFGQNIKSTTSVGKYSPQGDSPYGCVDMAGNVWEWTASDYNDANKVLRGGSWSDLASYVRTADRRNITPAFRYDDIGFRCVAAPGE